MLFVRQRCQFLLFEFSLLFNKSNCNSFQKWQYLRAFQGLKQASKPWVSLLFLKIFILHLMLIVSLWFLFWLFFFDKAAFYFFSQNRLLKSDKCDGIRQGYANNYADGVQDMQNLCNIDRINFTNYVTYQKRNTGNDLGKHKCTHIIEIEAKDRLFLKIFILWKLYLEIYHWVNANCRYKNL